MTRKSWSRSHPHIQRSAKTLGRSYLGHGDFAIQRYVVDVFHFSAILSNGIAQVTRLLEISLGWTRMLRYQEGLKGVSSGLLLYFFDGGKLFGSFHDLIMSEILDCVNT